MHLSLNTVNDSFDTPGPILGCFWDHFRRFEVILGRFRLDLVESTGSIVDFSRQGPANFSEVTSDEPCHGCWPELLTD